MSTKPTMKEVVNTAIKRFADYPEDRRPTVFTSTPEWFANKEAFTAFFMDRKINKETGKARSIFDIIIAYNDEKKPKTPFWPKNKTAFNINRKLKDVLEQRIKVQELAKGTPAAVADAGVDEAYSSATLTQVFRKGKGSKRAEAVKVPNRTLDERVETLADQLIDSAVDELNQADGDLDETIALKRKAHALGVFSYVSRHVNKKKEIAIKGQNANVGEANFLMKLMSLATSGKLGESEMLHLEESVKHDTE